MRERKRQKFYTVDPRKADKRFFLPVYTDPEAEALPPLPKTYGECIVVGRGGKGTPCTFIRCKHHLGVSVRIGKGRNKNTSIYITHPSADDPSVPDIAEMEYTCSLAFVDGQDTEAMPSYMEIARLMGCTQQRVQQMADRAMTALLPTVSKLTDG